MLTDNAAKIRPCTMADVMMLHGRLRKQDREEVWASHHLNPNEALRLAFRISCESWAASINDIVVCVFGCAPLPEGSGASPWLLGADEVESLPTTFIRQSRKHVRRMLADYGYLENYVDARNTVSIQWLKWLGFTFCDPQPYGVDGLPFHRFFARRDE